MSGLIDGKPRAEAQYRIAFEDVAYKTQPDIARYVADIFKMFPDDLTEIRIDATTGTLAVYVLIPAGVPPEALDGRAEALRQRWHKTRHDSPLHPELRLLRDKAEAAEATGDASLAGRYRRALSALIDPI